MSTVAQSRSNNARSWVFKSCIVLLLLSITFQLKEEFGIPWSVVVFALFIEGLFVILWICIDLVLARVGTDAPMITLRKNISTQVFILVLMACSTDFIKIYSSEQSTYNLCMLLLMCMCAGVVMFDIIKSTIKVLKSDRAR